MAKFNFKSSGINIEKVKSNSEKKSLQTTPTQKVGIKSPLELGNGDLFKMHTDLLEQITDNLKNLILTNYGERLGLYDFGANLRDVLTEYNSDIQDNYDDIVTDRISSAVEKWMPYVNIGELSITPEKNTINGLAVLAIKLTFTVNGISSNNKELKVRLFVI